MFVVFLVNGTKNIGYTDKPDVSGKNSKSNTKIGKKGKNTPPVDTGIDFESGVIKGPFDPPRGSK